MAQKTCERCGAKVAVKSYTTPEFEIQLYRYGFAGNRLPLCAKCRSEFLTWFRGLNEKQRGNESRGLTADERTGSDAQR